jgi:hypothetical protein
MASARTLPKTGCAATTSLLSICLNSEFAKYNGMETVGKRDEGSRGKWVKGMGSALWLWLSGRCGLPARSALAVIAIGFAVALLH